MSTAFISSSGTKGEVLSFNLNPRYMDDQSKIIHSLMVFEQELCYGSLYSQRNSENHWFVNPKFNRTYLIKPDRIGMIKKWDEQPLLPSEMMFDQLLEIGGTPSHMWTMEEEYIEFPCEACNVSGEWMQYSVIRFTKIPPFSPHLKNLHLLTEITDIQPSQFSMPSYLRLMNTMTEDIRMGFFPFMIRTKNDQFLTYNGDANFVSNGTIKASEVVCEVNFSYDLFRGLADIPYEQTVNIIGKWDERFDQLLMLLKEKRTASSKR